MRQSARENPRWLLVDVKLRRKTALLPLKRACASCRSYRACGCAAGQPAVDHAGDRGQMAGVLALLG